MNKNIINSLQEYVNNKNIPWHMPGHKRKGASSEFVDIEYIIKNNMLMDVTEVDGTDDLHHPEAMIKDSLEEIKRIYGSCESFYLVNGSTCGILSAISACSVGINKGKNRIIMASNCHKSVFNIVEVLGLIPLFVEPKWKIEDENFPDVNGVIYAADIEKICQQYDDICAVVLTSPTYEGILSDIKKISEITRKYNVYLIVDEAHGAHLPFMSMEAKSSIYEGADVVIQSLHKTLPALTQTGIMHVMREELINATKKYLGIYMSSSPSYILLCSMEYAVGVAKSRDYTGYINNLKAFIYKVNQLEIIKILNREDIIKKGAYEYDETRLVIYSKKKHSGTYLEKAIRRIGNIVVEMSGTDYMVLISTADDEKEDFDHLYNSLKQLDDELSDENNMLNIDNDINVYNVDLSLDYKEKIKKLEGKVADSNVYVYPPGSYIVREGDLFTEATIERIIKFIESGKRVHGLNIC